MPRDKEKLRDKKVLMSMLRKMYEIRLAEEAVYHAFLSEPMPGTIHQSIGEEAVAVGICHALRPDDYVTSTHRGHAHAIAKGATLRSFFAEMYAKSTGMSGGMAVRCTYLTRSTGSWAPSASSVREYP